MSKNPQGMSASEFSDQFTKIVSCHLATLPPSLDRFTAYLAGRLGETRSWEPSFVS